MSDSPYWHGKEPFFVIRTYDLPWRPSGATTRDRRFVELATCHRTLFAAENVTALVKEGPKAIVKI